MTQWVQDWVTELSIPDKNTGVPLCPFAQKAWDKGQVKVIETDTLWETIFKEVSGFGPHKVVMCVQNDPQQDYEELEARCDALNTWFAFMAMDMWLLSYQKNKAIVFVQSLSDLDSAAAALEKLGYYAEYSEDDYDRLIHKRRVLHNRFTFCEGRKDETLL